MIKDYSDNRRSLKTEKIDADLVVVGGGIAGTCCAITAARQGLKVALVQDRPVLGGNASSEVRLWILGATSHMGNNNRWAREGGVIDEILVENMYRNPEGNAVIFDTVLLDKVYAEPNLMLFLNTSVFEATKDTDDRIGMAKGFCSQNSTIYEFHSHTFCDASGDGVLGFLAGAAFRIGAEAKQEFGELLAPDEENNHLLGHSIYFYSRDTGRPVKFVPPKFALKDISKIPRYRQFRLRDHGCKLWWIEFGGAMDTVHQSEEIKTELWQIVYGVWDHIKNSGEFPEADSMTLEWVGTIPGKRESRRFEGDYMLTQQDIVEQRHHYDAVSFGGWAIDLHPVEGIYGDKAPCNQWHSKGVYKIPYRCLYSRNIKNLFLAGRLISATHIAFGSVRVMATCGHNAQAVAVAAALCKEHQCMPADIGHSSRINELQQRLIRCGQFIPDTKASDAKDLVQDAQITASSELQLEQLVHNGEWHVLDESHAFLIPVCKGRLPRIELTLRNHRATNLRVELRTCSRRGSYTPDRTVEVATIPLALKLQDENELMTQPSNNNGLSTETTQTAPKETVSVLPQNVGVSFLNPIESDQHVFVCLIANLDVEVAVSDEVLTGVSTLVNRLDSRVNTSSTQEGSSERGIDQVEFWLPKRRPVGKNLAIKLTPGINAYAASNIKNGYARPYLRSNAWMPSANDKSPHVVLSWDQPQLIQTIELSFDTDFDHPMEQVLMGHPETTMPLCPSSIRILDADNQILCQANGNYQTRVEFTLKTPVKTQQIKVEFEGSAGMNQSVMEMRCYGPR